jgi:hypothetical protein
MKRDYVTTERWRIERLAEDLDVAACYIFSQLSEPWRAIGAVHPKTYAEARAHYYATMHNVLAYAAEHATVPNVYLGTERYRCPLCGDWPSGHPNGYGVPDGLRNHLLGQGRQRQCDVMRVLYGYLHRSANREGGREVWHPYQ